MAYSFATLSGTDLSAWTADKPLVLGQSWGRTAQASGALIWTEDGNSTDSDASAANNPAKYSQDDFDHLQTQPNDAADDWYLVWDFGSEVAEIDGVALLNHNIGTIGGVTIELEVADDATFSTNLRSLATPSAPTDDNRLVLLDLRHTGSDPIRYSSVRYFRIHFSKGTTITPAIGEVIVSRRRQLRHNPLDGWDERDRQTTASVHVSRSGVKRKFVHSKKQRLISARLIEHIDANKDDLFAWWEDDTDGGSHPWLWVDNPNTNAGGAAWMHFDDDRQRAPSQGPQARIWSVTASEQGPNFKGLES